MNKKTHYIFRDKITDFFVNEKTINIFMVNSEDPAFVIHSKDSKELEEKIRDLTIGDSRVIVFEFPGETKEEIKEEIKTPIKRELKEGEQYCSYCDISIIKKGDSCCDACLPF